MPDSRSREPGFKSPLCYLFEDFAFSFSPRCPSSLNCINEYLAMIPCIQFCLKPDKYCCLGLAGDVFEYQLYMPFSTFDYDTSASMCALAGHGAWWWAGSCDNSGLNGVYGSAHEQWLGGESIVGTKMMIRPGSFRSGMEGRYIEFDTIIIAELCSKQLSVSFEQSVHLTVSCA